MKLVLTLVMIGAVGYAVALVVMRYRSAQGTTWERLFAATKDSATLFWAGFVSVVTAAFNGIMNISDFLGLPEVRTFVTDHFSPEIASGIILAILFLLSLARLRTLQ